MKKPDTNVFTARLVQASALQASVLEAAPRVVGEAEYEKANGRKPQLYGKYVFCKDKVLDPDRHRQGREYLALPRLPYHDAKDIALGWAEKQGYDVIYLQPWQHSLAGRGVVATLAAQYCR